MKTKTKCDTDAMKNSLPDLCFIVMCVFQQTSLHGTVHICGRILTDSIIHLYREMLNWNWREKHNVTFVEPAELFILHLKGRARIKINHSGFIDSWPQCRGGRQKCWRTKTVLKGKSDFFFFSIQTPSTVYRLHCSDFWFTLLFRESGTSFSWIEFLWKIELETE